MNEATFSDRARRVITRRRIRTGRYEGFLWAGLIVVVLSIQWPALKGFSCSSVFIQTRTTCGR